MGQEGVSGEPIHADGLPIREEPAEAGTVPETEDAPAAAAAPDLAATAAPEAPDAPAVAESAAPPDAPAAAESAAPPDAPAAAESAAPPDAPAAAESAAPPDAPAAAESVAPPDAPAATAAPDAPAPPDGEAERFDRRIEEALRLLARQTDHAEQLHAENQRLRQGELRAALLPLVRDLLRVHDDLARLAGFEGDAAADLEIARQSILDALARNGILPATPATGEPFDARLHRAEAPVDTDDPNLHRTIAATLRSGFAWEDGTVVRAADVRVYRHTPAEQTTPATTTTH
jgi:molecular chaperone GrpE (heat shock protein)